ncbi:TIGR03560 family F420-dependent LLM class oxidoreductase [Myxococcota bacterium]|nr:TIGR03560 family F420-dependent LLM class oxidoreductase [Myxococcota bacterium]
MAPPPIRFGLQTATENITWPALLDIWKFAEEIGYDSLWTSDHFVTSMFQKTPEAPVFDGWTALAALAALTQRVRLGVMVTGNPYRHPPQLAKIATTLDHISDGRLIMGIGAGWFEAEHQMYGVPYHSNTERANRLGEALQILNLLWTQERSSFDGNYYQIENAICSPKPVQSPRIPIWVGGWGEKIVLRDAARYADGWNTTGSPQQLAPKVDVFKRHCDAAGRDFDEFEKSIMHLGLFESSDPNAVRDYIKSRRMPEEFRDQFMLGTHEQMRDQIARFIDLGFNHFVCQVTQPFDREAIEGWYTEVALAFKSS